ncbi:hypothetical protein ABZ027_30505, partial [Streptomyces sp. NPDC006332]|uniref:hypothetical protein n=1 Tax=Streptomyces sp. NPDC006332 TaxID=3155456 RepID=UPI0033A97331
IVVNLSGRGDKDMDTAARYFGLYDSAVRFGRSAALPCLWLSGFAAKHGPLRGRLATGVGAGSWAIILHLGSDGVLLSKLAWRR